MELSLEEQKAHVMRLLNALEVTDRDKRLKVSRAILYLAQGMKKRHATRLRDEMHYQIKFTPF